MHLPTLNAFLNGTSAVFLTAGYFFIRKKRVAAHRLCMLAAVAASTVFLGSYLYHHFHVGATRYPGTGWSRVLYFVILISHTVLAAALVPMVSATLYQARRENFLAHARLARWTLPFWIYVSVTGIVIYLMLYGGIR